MNTIKYYILIVLTFFTFTITKAQNKPDDIIGIWLVQKKDGTVEIYKKGNKYYGKIDWLSQPNDTDGKLKIDKHNPDASKRKRPIAGLTIVENLTWDGKGKWEDGSVYNPSNGKLYSAFVKMKDKNTLEFTGFLGFSFIGQTETWTRKK